MREDIESMIDRRRMLINTGLAPSKSEARRLVQQGGIKLDGEKVDDFNRIQDSVVAEIIEEHTMHPEEFELSEAAANQVNRALAEGRRVVCVGTTTVRVLEGQAFEVTPKSEVQSSNAGGRWRVRAGKGQTDLYIYPGYEWRVVGGLLTNFHLPKSTLLMLVSALAGREAVLAAYEHVIGQKYRFYSFGDAMLIV